MKARVTEECIGCGLCPTICPEVFEMGDDNLAHVTVDQIPDNVIDKAQEAAQTCPTEAIILE